MIIKDKKIYIIGAHSTGKSTLAQAISEEYNIPVLNEVARIVLENFESSIEDIRKTPKLINEFQQSIFEEQLKIEETVAPWVADRTIDCVIYALAHAPGAKSFINHEILDEWMNRIKQGIVLFCRPEKDLMEDDGVRETPTWEGIIRIDASIQTLFSLYHVPYISISGLSMADRMAAVRTIVDPIMYCH